MTCKCIEKSWTQSPGYKPATLHSIRHDALDMFDAKQNAEPILNPNCCIVHTRNMESQSEIQTAERSKCHSFFCRNLKTLGCDWQAGWYARTFSPINPSIAHVLLGELTQLRVRVLVHVVTQRGMRGGSFLQVALQGAAWRLQHIRTCNWDRQEETPSQGISSSPFTLQMLSDHQPPLACCFWREFRCRTEWHLDMPEVNLGMQRVSQRRFWENGIVDCTQTHWSCNLRWTYSSSRRQKALH